MDGLAGMSDVWWLRRSALVEIRLCFSGQLWRGELGWCGLGCGVAVLRVVGAEWRWLFGGVGRCCWLPVGLVWKRAVGISWLVSDRVVLVPLASEWAA